MPESQSSHEPSGIAVRDLLRIAAVIAVAVVAVAILIRLLVRERVGALHASGRATAAMVPPAPRLQPDPHADLESMRAEQRSLLSSWAWTDASQHYARIPIERAMQIYAERHGDPARSGP
ncbi:MAG TPA: hypothetical protein VGF89_08655 [Steroidobacteraceae bacterium]|jgi:hypothetical protein